MEFHDQLVCLFDFILPINDDIDVLKVVLLVYVD